MSLTNLERTWARVALETMFPSSAQGIPGVDVIDGGASLDEACRDVPARVALGLRASVWLVTFAPIFVLFRFRTLPGLDDVTREKVVLSLLSNRVYVVRQLTLLLKAFGALLFVSAPGVRECIVAREPLVHIGRKEEVLDVA